MSIIFHIDVNSAFLSWTAVEELKNGADRDLRKMTAIVGGNQESRHGVVLAKSLPAKKYGIHTGEPVVNAIRKCPNLTMVAPDHEMYREYSQKMMDFLRSYTPDIEQVSIDECFLDFTGIAYRFSSPVDGALEIKNKIRDRFGFTVNIGISTNKLLAKMASDFEKPDKVHTLFPEEIEEKMWHLPVSELYMAGHSSVEVLKKLEIHTIGELAKADPEILEIHLKSHGRALWESANGIGDDRVVSEKVRAKGIGNSVTLPRDVTGEEEADRVLLELSESVGARLRKAGQRANMLSVEIKYHTFQTASHQKQLLKATNSDLVIYNTARELFWELWDGKAVRLLGIRSSRLEDEGEPEQMSIFDLPLMPSGKQKEWNYSETEQSAEEERRRAVKNERLQKLDKALDGIKKKYGEDAVKRGRLLPPGKE